MHTCMHFVNDTMSILQHFTAKQPKYQRPKCTLLVCSCKCIHTHIHAVYAAMAWQKWKDSYTICCMYCQWDIYQNIATFVLLKSINSNLTSGDTSIYIIIIVESCKNTIYKEQLMKVVALNQWLQNICTTVNKSAWMKWIIKIVWYDISDT